MRSKDTSPDLYNLARPVPSKFILKAPQGKFGSFVPHYVIAQILLATVGPYDWQLVEVLRGDSAGTIKKDTKYEKFIDLHDVIVGAVYRLTVTIDGTTTVIEEVGETDAYLKPNDGARLKHASSDALKRAAMRLGVGIQLWCKTGVEHFLPTFLVDEAAREAEVGVVQIGGEELDDDVDDGRQVTHWVIPDDSTMTSTIDVEQYKSEAEYQKYKPDDWNLLLSTLEVPPTVKDTKATWLAWVEQLTGLMVATGCWKADTDTSKLNGLGKDELVRKVIKIHRSAEKTAAQHAPF